MIKSERDYKAILERIEELLEIAENVEDPEAKGFGTKPISSSCC
jgi:HTH-type transcriptional regulator/antitoxin HigA